MSTFDLSEGDFDGQYDAHNCRVDGVLTYHNGVSYTGGFVDNYPHGPGKLYFPKTNTSVEGKFVKGVCIQGKMQYVDGSSFSGAFEWTPTFDVIEKQSADTSIGTFLWCNGLKITIRSNLKCVTMSGQYIPIKERHPNAHTTAGTLEDGFVVNGFEKYDTLVPYVKYTGRFLNHQCHDESKDATLSYVTQEMSADHEASFNTSLDMISSSTSSTSTSTSDHEIWSPDSNSKYFRTNSARRVEYPSTHGALQEHFIRIKGTFDEGAPMYGELISKILITPPSGSIAFSTNGNNVNSDNSDNSDDSDNSTANSNQMMNYPQGIPQPFSFSNTTISSDPYSPTTPSTLSPISVQSIYVGTFVNHLREGDAIQRWISLEPNYSHPFKKFTGIFYQDLMSSGILEFSDGSIFEGDFMNGIPYKGTWTWPQGNCTYFGSLDRMGRFHSISDLIGSNVGSSSNVLTCRLETRNVAFVGHFDAGIPTLAQSLLYKTGLYKNNTYSGAVNASFQPHGKGTLTYVENDENDQKDESTNNRDVEICHNYGLSTFVQSTFYQQSSSTMIELCYPDLVDGLHVWDTFHGIFENGKPSNGMMKYTNGSIYTGQFSPSGIKHGEGVYQYRPQISLADRILLLLKYTKMVFPETCFAKSASEDIVTSTANILDKILSLKESSNDDVDTSIYLTTNNKSNKNNNNNNNDDDDDEEDNDDDIGLQSARISAILAQAILYASQNLHGLPIVSYAGTYSHGIREKGRKVLLNGSIWESAFEQETQISCGPSCIWIPETGSKIPTTLSSTGSSSGSGNVDFITPVASQYLNHSSDITSVIEYNSQVPTSYYLKFYEGALLEGLPIHGVVKYTQPLWLSTLINGTSSTSSASEINSSSTDEIIVEYCGPVDGSLNRQGRGRCLYYHGIFVYYDGDFINDQRSGQGRGLLYPLHGSNRGDGNGRSSASPSTSLTVTVFGISWDALAKAGTSSNSNLTHVGVFEGSFEENVPMEGEIEYDYNDEKYTYRGEVSDTCVPHGTGSITYPITSKSFEGIFLHSNPFRGIMTYPNGIRFKSQFWDVHSELELMYGLVESTDMYVKDEETKTEAEDGAKTETEIETETEMGSGKKESLREKHVIKNAFILQNGNEYIIDEEIGEVVRDIKQQVSQRVDKTIEKAEAALLGLNSLVHKYYEHYQLQEQLASTASNNPNTPNGVNDDVHGDDSDNNGNLSLTQQSRIDHSRKYTVWPNLVRGFSPELPIDVCRTLHEFQKSGTLIRLGLDQSATLNLLNMMITTVSNCRLLVEKFENKNVELSNMFTQEVIDEFLTTINSKEKQVKFDHLLTDAEKNLITTLQEVERVGHLVQDVLEAERRNEEKKAARLGAKEIGSDTNDKTVIDKQKQYSSQEYEDSQIGTGMIVVNQHDSDSDQDHDQSQNQNQGLGNIVESRTENDSNSTSNSTPNQPSSPTSGVNRLLIMYETRKGTSLPGQGLQISLDEDYYAAGITRESVIDAPSRSIRDIILDEKDDDQSEILLSNCLGENREKFTGQQHDLKDISELCTLIQSSKDQLFPLTDSPSVLLPTIVEHEVILDGLVWASDEFTIAYEIYSRLYQTISFIQQLRTSICNRLDTKISRFPALVIDSVLTVNEATVAAAIVSKNEKKADEDEDEDEDEDDEGDENESDIHYIHIQEIAKTHIHDFIAPNLDDIRVLLRQILPRRTKMYLSAAEAFIAHRAYILQRYIPSLSSLLRKNLLTVQSIATISSTTRQNTLTSAQSLNDNVISVIESELLDINAKRLDSISMWICDAAAKAIIQGDKITALQQLKSSYDSIGCNVLRVLPQYEKDLLTLAIEYGMPSFISNALRISLENNPTTNPSIMNTISELKRMSLTSSTTTTTTTSTPSTPSSVSLSSTPSFSTSTSSTSTSTSTSSSLTLSESLSTQTENPLQSLSDDPLSIPGRPKAESIANALITSSSTLGAVSEGDTLADDSINSSLTRTKLRSVLPIEAILETKNDHGETYLYTCLFADIPTNIPSHIVRENPSNPTIPLIQRRRKCAKIFAKVGYAISKPCDNSGKSILHLACERNEADTVAFIINVLYPSRLPSWKDIPGYSWCFDISRELPDLKEKRNSLHFACLHGDITIIRHILHSGFVGINSPDIHGDTPFHILFTNRRHLSVDTIVDIAKEMVQSGCDPKLKNRNGRRCTQLWSEYHKYNSLSPLSIDTLLENLEKEREKMLKNTPALIPESHAHLIVTDAVPPRWADDDDHIQCVSCSCKFTMFNRRHHCRLCGLIYCSTCTKGLIAFKSRPKDTSRTCDGCTNWMQQHHQDIDTSS